MDNLPLFDSEALEDTGRKECYRCKRPEKVCLCSWLPERPQKLQNVRFVVLQHPNEIYRPMRTMTILESSVTNESCITFRGRRFSPAKYENLHRIISTEKAVVLYPSKDAMPFNDIYLSEGVSFCNFILIDGTWQQAKEMYGQNEFLQKLVKISISDTSSRYLIRRQPTAHSLSTLEAAAIVVRLWEQDPSLTEALLTALEEMCRIQKDHREKAHCVHSTSDK